MSDSQGLDISDIFDKPVIGTHIGICMSGGGYRAAAFHLGTLDYLNNLKIIDKLTAISSVSGGTFTVTKYIISLAEKTPFQAFFTDYYSGLQNINLLDKGFKKLASQKNAVPSGRQDLIVSMAQVYCETFFRKKENDDTSPYYFDTILNGDFAVSDVMLNATDFRSGIAFRFQRSINNKGKIGNSYNYIAPSDAAKIRLADIVAASSCFPGGFEPLSFPYDFTWENGEVPSAVALAFPKDNATNDATAPQGPVPLMDGGVYDNQGLQSLLLADKRNRYSLDLVIISDVSQPSIELFEMPKSVPYGGISIGLLYKLGLLFFALCLLTLVTIIGYAYHDFINGLLTFVRAFFLYTIPFCLTGIAAYSLYRIRCIINEDVLPHIPIIGNKAWHSIKLITVGQLRNMMKLRISSLLALTSSIFMKRVRALVFEIFYGRGKEVYNGKRVSNLIYSLSPMRTRSEPLQDISLPSANLDKVACVAFNQPTTLWFAEDYQQACLVASGQATLCYNMIKLFKKRKEEHASDYCKDDQIVYEKLLRDWAAFNNDPFFLLALSIDIDVNALMKKVNTIKCNWGMFE